ncbi:MAG: DUF2283 domain-containing protein [Bacteroidetes bacterium]|nr:MAG: DUF2283 domain-containing protein [Bacteroidota bacterium]
MEKEINVWYDKEGDFLEVIFEKKKGYFKQTESDEVMEKIDLDGNIIGFSILNFNAIKKGNAISVLLKS